MGDWKVSSYSGGGNNCVEVKVDLDEVLIRDTKDRDGGTFQVSPEAWTALLAAIGRRS